jgi:PAS domain S-box-containing protein
MTRDAQESVSIAQLKAENAELRGRIAELERALAARTDGQLREMLESLPIPLRIYAPDGQKLVATREGLAFDGGGAAATAPPNLFEDPVARARGLVAAFERACQEDRAQTLQTQAPAGSEDGPASGQRVIERTYVPVRGASGARWIVEICADVTERQRAKESARRNDMLLRGVIDNAPLFIYAKDADGRYLMMNGLTQRLFGLAWANVQGKTDFDLFPHELASTWRAEELKIMESGQLAEFESTYAIEGKNHNIYTTKFPLKEGETTVGVCSVSLDVTGPRTAEAENQRLQAEIIRVQEATLRALSTPLMPIAKGVIVMPLIGTINRERAQHVLDALLRGIDAHGARLAILDVTGVSTVDAEVAAALVQAAQAARLLGTEVLLTGIQPMMAKTLIDLDADLGGIVTRGTLESGIAYALRRR